MDFRLHHVALYTNNLERSIEAYSSLGLKKCMDLDNGDIFRFVFFGSGRGFMFQLEPPERLYDYESNWQDQHGNTFNHFCSFVDDCFAAEEHFKEHGMHIEFPTSHLLFVDSLVAFDLEKQNIELLQYTDPPFVINDIDRTKPPADDELTLQQISLITEDVLAQVKFYERALGFKHIKGIIEDGPVWMCDNHYNQDTANMLLKFSPVDQLNEYQQRMYKKHGPCIDHIVFTVKDIKIAWKRCISGTMKIVRNLAFDNDLDCLAGTLEDPDGNHVLIQEPFYV